MQKLISYPLSLLVLVLILSVLIIFQPIQWICFNLFGYESHKRSVDFLNAILIRIVHLLGTTFDVKNRDTIPKNVPIIFVANHQSLYDIIVFVWFFRAFHPKFVSKKELGKNIPSVSYNLKYGGSVLIDRKEPKQAIPEIKKLSEYIEKHNRSAVIFPEGTRSRNGKSKEFAQTGLKMLCKYAPSAYVVPVSISNSWKLLKYGTFPYGLGNKITFEVHQALAVSEHNFTYIMQKTESDIINGLLN